MANISYYIKKVYNNKNQRIPINIFLTRAKDDLMFFYTKCTVNGELIHNTISGENILVSNYIKAKKTKNAMKRLLYLYKLRKAKQSVKYDLFFNDLKIIKSHQKIELYSNDTIYYFRLSDIVNIWMGCLTKCENMFCTPIKIKNPYTNIELSKHNLYNIYLSLLYSHFHIPKWITFFFEAEFDLDRFTYDNYTILKELAIDDFMENGSIYEKFENILNMMHEYREYLNYIIIRTPYTFREKSKIVKKLSPYLKHYLYGEYCCHPLKKKRSKNMSKRGIKQYFENNDDIPYYREQPIRLSEWNSETTLSSRISRILTRSREELNYPSSNIPSPLSLSNDTNRTPPTSQLNQREGVSRNLNLTVRETNTGNSIIRPLRIGQRNRSHRQSLQSIVPETPLSGETSLVSSTNTSTNRQNATNSVDYRSGSLFSLNLNNRTSRDPFTPSFTLNRTPNSERSGNNTGSNFNMRMFNR